MIRHSDDLKHCVLKTLTDFLHLVNITKQNFKTRQ